MSSKPTRGPAARSLVALDALNVFLADVRDGLGPYLGIYLLARRGWGEGRIGVAMAAMGIATVAAQTPAGALIDRVPHKRTLVMLAAVVVALGSVGMVAWPTFPVILGAQVAIGAAAAIFPPAIAALSLGLVGHARLARRMGRNEAFNHAGNVAAAVLAALIGDGIAIEGIFYLLAGMALATVAATGMIRGKDINDDLARGAADAEGSAPHVVGLRALLADRRIVTFALAVTLFHFANAAMLPFAGQKLAHVQERATGRS